MTRAEALGLVLEAAEAAYLNGHESSDPEWQAEAETLGQAMDLVREAEPVDRWTTLAGRVVDLAEWNEGTAFAAAVVYRGTGDVSARVLQAAIGGPLETLAEGRGLDPETAADVCLSALEGAVGQLWKADQ